MINWNKEQIQLRAKGNPVDHHVKVLFDDVEVGRINTGLPKNAKSASREFYTISSAAYGEEFASLYPCPSVIIDLPPSTVDIVLMVVISLCLKDRSYED